MIFCLIVLLRDSEYISREKILVLDRDSSISQRPCKRNFTLVRGEAGASVTQIRNFASSRRSQGRDYDVRATRAARNSRTRSRFATVFPDVSGQGRATSEKGRGSFVQRRLVSAGCRR